MMHHLLHSLKKNSQRRLVVAAKKKKEAQQALKEERKGKRPRLVKSDDSELDDYDPADATGVYEEEHEVELSGLQGIQW